MTIIIILAIAGVLRLVGLNQSLWLDEATTAIVARDLPWGDFFVSFLPQDFHPPLYYIIIKIWAGFTQNYSEAFLRLPSVIFGLVTIYLVYKIGQFVENKRLGRVTAALLATAPLHIYYSQEARMYSFAAMLATLAVYLYISKKYSLLALATLACFWTDYLIGFMAVVLVAHAWFFRKENFRSVFKTIIAAAFASLPMLLFLPQQLANGMSVEGSNWWGILGQTTFKNIFLIPVKFVFGRITFPKPAYQLIVLIVGSIFGFIYYRASKYFKKYSLFWLWLFIPIVGSIALGFFIPVLTYFRFLFVLPAFYLLLGVGILSSKKYFQLLLFTALAINIIFSSIYLFFPKFHREDWRGLVAFIEGSRENSQVVFPANSQMEVYKYYAKEKNFGGPDTLSPDSQEIWLIRYVYDIFDPEDTTRHKVEAMGYEKILEHDFRGVVVYQYGRRN